jgi:hypothetical protein
MRWLRSFALAVDHSPIGSSRPLRAWLTYREDGSACSPSVSLNHLSSAITVCRRARVVARFCVSVET